MIFHPVLGAPLRGEAEGGRAVISRGPSGVEPWRALAGEQRQGGPRLGVWGGVCESHV